MNIRSYMNLKSLINITLFILMASFLMSCNSDEKLKWNQEEGYRWAQLDPGFWGKVGFKELSNSHTNIDFTNYLSKQNMAENRNLFIGSGVATGDVDGDGLPDIYFAQLEGPNKLYKNMGGMDFKDITQRSGVAHDNYLTTGVALEDIDGDGDLDILITGFDGGNALYINDGKGNFTLKKDSGLTPGNGSTTMALADIDGDGDLDLYVTNYKVKSTRDIYSLNELVLENITRKNADSLILVPPYDQDYVLIKNDGNYDARELGEVDELFINNGDGTFQKVKNTEERFLTKDGNPKGLSRDWGLTAKFQDLNGDNLPDLYVCNDYWTPDRVWMNQGDGTFRAIEEIAIRKFSLASMGVDFSDVNRDGYTDIFTTEMLSQYHKNRLRQFVTQSPFVNSTEDLNHQELAVQNAFHVNRGDNTFAEIAYFSGLEASGWSWGTRFLDVDLDGYEDLIITTGNAADFQDMDTQERLGRRMIQSGDKTQDFLLEFPSLQLPNKIFRNNQDLTFEDKSTEWGFRGEDVSQGLASADFDLDGDLDLVMNRFNQQAAFYENTNTKSRIAVRLEGKAPNTEGIGAKVQLKGGFATQEDEVVAGGSYLSDSSSELVFAANPDVKNYTIIVLWPSGEKTKIDNVKANTVYEIQEPQDGEIYQQESPGDNNYLFEDISFHLNHTHHENNFNDFNVQPLLPNKLSQLGPGISWIDYDRDGDDDLLVSSGKGGELRIFENLGNSSFLPKNLGALTEESTGDQTAILGWAEEEKTKIIVGQSNYEREYSGSVSASNYSLDHGKIVSEKNIPPIFSSTGPLAAADYDGDGDLDLFIGGRFVPGHYPMDASSRLFTNDDGEFTLDEINSKTLREIGLVTSAVFFDYDRDGDPDLLVSTEWGAIKLFRNMEGEFREVTQVAGLQEFNGWWQGLATGDFNNDGRPDIVATNIGLNSSYQLYSGQPFKIYYDDFDKDRRMEILEAYFDENVASYVPRRQLYDLDRSLSAITRSIQSHTKFAQSSLQDILDRNLKNISSKEINTLQHMVFINQGQKFSPHPLPDIAQWSNGFYAGVADYDNDGNEDLFLSQNFFGVPPKRARLDAGRGLWLRGNGKGAFEPVSGNKTGIKVYGEQRGAALSDFNKDGKIDLAVSQNAASTKLYLNQTDKKGIRIQLIGPPANRDGIGSGIRLLYEDDSKGPYREIQAGSGYWSQNSATQVMGKSGTPSAIEIHWFDGTLQQVPYEQGKDEYRVQYPD
ncbi:FG-GAP-like repeat-containing protein [Halalkalibaculum sp. DA3122]|uniref:FG-GAP-like repeat-containing protein n=1 Tax=Halalkalibaculum sp. DA3122 TaxID=3373607 RepID=UPI0037553BA4